MTKETHSAEAQQICARHNITINTLKSITGSFDKKLFIINDDKLLRISEGSMAVEQEKFRRVADLPHVPHILHTGTLERETTPLHYTLVTLIPGEDFVDGWHSTSPAQQAQLGRDVAAFMDTLHSVHNTHYDIGLYIPIIPDFKGTWWAGHQQYLGILALGVANLDLTPESGSVFNKAIGYLFLHADALTWQAGPVLLHNDLHPKNIMLHQGAFSGVIDWECAQYGEADFELTHLIHWCAFPPEPGIDYRPFLRGLFEAAPVCSQVPDLATRLTYYQIEHEIQQILWNPANASWRVPHLTHWLDGGVDALLQQIQ